MDQTKMQQEAYAAAKKKLEARKAAGKANLVIRDYNGLPVVTVYYPNVGGLRTKLDDLLMRWNVVFMV